MSASVVNIETMNAVVSLIDNMHAHCAFTFGRVNVRESTPADLTELGRQLFIMNTEAVNQRYGENSGPSPYTFRERDYTMTQRVKAAKCLRYQCSEGDVPEWELYVALDKMIGEACEAIVASTSAYNNAHWDIPENAPETRRVRIA